MRKLHRATSAVWLWAAACLLICAPHLASAQTCTNEMTRVVGSTATGDGSTSPTDGMFRPVPCYVTVCEDYGPIPGQVTMNHVWNGVGSYTFNGTNSNYFPENDEGSATCYMGTETPTPCPHCVGSFAFTFFSNMGAVEGHAYYLPSFKPVVGGQVFARRVRYGVNLGPNPTDNDGKYEFHYPGPNKWGLPLTRDGDSGPGFEEYGMKLASVSDDERWVPVTLTSNKLEVADVYAPEDLEEPSRAQCEPPDMSPSPSAGSGGSSGPTVMAPNPGGKVSKPVSVTTGNVDLDQTDATIPGLGLGLQFTRSYNSQNIIPGRFGIFGPGWTIPMRRR